MCLFAVVALGSSARAAIGQQLWLQRYHGPVTGGHNALAIAADSSGNVFVTGYSAGNNGVNDYATIKYSDSGMPLWTNRYHGPGTGSDAASALAVDRNGDVIVTGASSRSGTSTDYATIKYSGSGAPLWTNRFSNGSARAVAVDTNANVFVTGDTTSAIVTIKYSAAGAPLWTNSYFGPSSGYHIGSAIAVDGAGNAFVTGTTTGVGTGDDMVTLAYLSNGTSWWVNRYTSSGTADDNANAIALDTNGNVFITGGVVAGAVTRFATFKYSNNGIPMWTNIYGLYGDAPYGGASDIAVDVAGNVIITGTSDGGGTYLDIATIKYSNSGLGLWTNRWNRLYDDGANAITTDKNGNVFVTGHTDDDNLRYDRLTIAYSAAGGLLWTNRYDGPANLDDSGNAIAVDPMGNVFVTGYSSGTNNTSDIATIKYAGVQPIPLTTQWANSNLVLTWANPTFQLQAATTVTATFTNIPSATSPYTNSAGSPRYFRLKLN